jgi:GNAT superfamily N-acetyltransferase
VEIFRIDPDDTPALSEWHALWQITDDERFPGVPGWDLQNVVALAREHGAVERQLLAARTGDGTMAGAAYLELPMRDNAHSAGVDVRVHPAHRRQGIGTALVEELGHRARAAGRTTLNSLVEVPIAEVGAHASEPFALRMGFTITQDGNRRHLTVPVDPDRLDELRSEVNGARDAAAYRIFAFVTPWPAEYLEDQCELQRRMSTDQPQGDEQAEEEVWDEARIRESDALLAAQGMRKVAAVAQHIKSGRLVAFTELALTDRHPTEAWQWATLVLREHRGHRLGLAVKVANLELLAKEAPDAIRVITGNASVNAPMIAVNDMMGFEIVANGTFRQKTLGSS